MTHPIREARVLARSCGIMDRVEVTAVVADGRVLYLRSDDGREWHARPQGRRRGWLNGRNAIRSIDWRAA